MKHSQNFFEKIVETTGFTPLQSDMDTIKEAVFKDHNISLNHIEDTEKNVRFVLQGNKEKDFDKIMKGLIGLRILFPELK